MRANTCFLKSPRQWFSPERFHTLTIGLNEVRPCHHWKGTTVAGGSAS